MRIRSNTDDISRVYSSNNKLVEKIQPFPQERVSKSTSSKGKTGVVVDISEYAKKVKAQNESILSMALTKEISAQKKSTISMRMKNTFYDKPEVVDSIADKMLTEAVVSKKIGEMKS